MRSTCSRILFGVLCSLACWGAESLAAPAAPGNLVPTTMAVLTYNTPIKFSWSPVTVSGQSVTYCMVINDESGVSVYNECEQGNFSSAAFRTLDLSSVPFNNVRAPLPAGKAYWWAVWARQTDGVFSPCSGFVGFNVPENPKKILTLHNSTNITSGGSNTRYISGDTVELTWESDKTQDGNQEIQFSMLIQGHKTIEPYHYKFTKTAKLSDEKVRLTIPEKEGFDPGRNWNFWAASRTCENKYRYDENCSASTGKTVAINLPPGYDDAVQYEADELAAQSAYVSDMIQRTKTDSSYCEQVKVLTNNAKNCSDMTDAEKETMDIKLYNSAGYGDNVANSQVITGKYEQCVHGVLEIIRRSYPDIPLKDKGDAKNFVDQDSATFNIMNKTDAGDDRDLLLCSKDNPCVIVYTNGYGGSPTAHGHVVLCYECTKQKNSSTSYSCTIQESNGNTRSVIPPYNRDGWSKTNSFLANKVIRNKVYDTSSKDWHVVQYIK